mmetsp:Transcript_8007/g.20536  ORF Transcript_8007/g.20536 Transcript_8007/m.20536 type:complete len:150 (+) Transcript_8007:1-450(+)
MNPRSLQPEAEERGTMSGLAPIPCDFLGFMDALKRLRKVDDLITVRMNKAIPAAMTQVVNAKAQEDNSEKCAVIYDEIQTASAHRIAGINHCLGVQAAVVKKLQDSNDPGARDAQRRFRLMKRELSSEEVLKNQVMHHFSQRCNVPTDL